jgi:hypothetical protein
MVAAANKKYSEDKSQVYNHKMASNLYNVTCIKHTH